MIYEEQLSKIEHLFQNYKDRISIIQDTKYSFVIKGYNEKLVLGKQIIIETNLIDYFHSQLALLTGGAAITLKKIFNEQHSDNVQSIVLQLLKWKIVFVQKFQRYIVVILECQYLGNIDIALDLSVFNPEIYSKETKKIKYTILKTNLSKQQQLIEPQNFKNVKIENQVYSKPNQNSIIFDENLINLSLIDITINRSYQKFCQDSQTISELLANKKKNWILEGRIIQKSQMLEFKKKNSNISTYYFKIIILDQKQDIIIGLFYDKANQKMFDFLEKGRVYTFKNGRISKNNLNYSQSITFTQFSIIQVSQNYNLPHLPQLSLKKIYDLQNQQKDQKIDLVAAIQEIKTISGMGLQLMVLDQTGRIAVKLLGKQYANQMLSIGQILIFKNLLFKNQQNFTYLSSYHNTIILDNSDFIEVQALHEWLLEKDLDQIMKPNSDCLTVNLKQLEENVFKKLNEDRTNHIETVFIIGYLTELSNFIYPRCPNNKCHSKMEYSQQRQNYRCKKCFIENNSPQQSFILNLKIMDEYNSIEAIVFDDFAVKLLGLTADQFSKLNESQQNMILIVSKFRQFKIKLQVLFNEYNGQIRPKYKVVEIYDIDYNELAQKEMKTFEEVDYLLNVSQIL
ncbi:unnamed protein product [Paramecium sonneborni]|uniref:Replication factor A C-terminal domain-containing protein n=1 Tax=Paramecium sonneborni TaxID=65129 RepID=A0A8S1KTY7_9CILI|nr:unnamed protein product [Paramecium sonneborni]